jgi:hypothetical protein
MDGPDNSNIQDVLGRITARRCGDTSSMRAITSGGAYHYYTHSSVLHIHFERFHLQSP